MGFSPEQIGRMSLYQYAACVDGFNEANGNEASIEAPSDEEFRSAVAALG